MIVFDKFLIDGEWVAPDGRGHFDVRDASTEEVIGRIPDGGAPPAQPTYFPPVGGFRFGMFSLPPQSRAVGPQPADTAAAARELEEKLPGLAKYMEPDAPGMHTTDTIDFEVVLDGEVWLELDGGKEVHLKPGDTVVQNGTRHAWHNKGNKPARLAVFITGAHHRKFGT